MCPAKALVGTANHRENRRNTRLFWPSLDVSFDGGSYRTTDWSLGGARVTGYSGPRAPGDEVEGTIQETTDTIRHPFKAVVMRRDSGGVALKFTVLSDSAMSALALMTQRFGI